jgi:soluble lytic murein transglycosylase-like protein
MQTLPHSNDEPLKLGHAFSVQEQEANSADLEQQRIDAEAQAEAQRQATREATPFSQVVEDAFSINNFTYQLANEDGSRWSGNDDPTFLKSTMDIKKELEDAKLPLSYIKRLTEAGSQQRYDAIFGKLREETQARERLDAQHGLNRFMLETGALLADPVAIGVGLVAPEIAIPAKAVGAAKIIQGAARGLASWGAASAAVAVPQYGLMETKTRAEVALEVAGGSFLGVIGGGAKGAYGAWMDGKLAAANANLFNTIKRQMVSAPREVSTLLDKYATEYAVPPDLVYAIASQESRFNQAAISSKGAVGVMQLMPKTAKGLGVDANDLEQNIKGGVQMLGTLLKKYDNDYDKALAAYNHGEGNLAKLLKKHPEDWREHLPTETKGYLRGVNVRAQAASKEVASVKEFWSQQEQHFGNSSAGAAQVKGTFIRTGQDTVAVDDAPFALYGGVRFDAAGLLKSDENPYFRQLGIIGEDNVGLNRDGSAAAYSAEEHANQLIHTSQASWLRGFGEAFSEFSEASPSLAKADKLQAFNDAVMESVLTGIPHESKAVNAAAQETVKFFKRYADEGFNSGSRYFDGVPANATYLPRIINPEKWDAVMAKHGYSDIVNLVRDAFLKNLDDATTAEAQELATKLAKGYVANVDKRGSIGSTGALHGIDLNDADALKPLLEAQGLSEGEIREVIEGLTKGSTKGTAPARLKRRVDLDMSTTRMTPDGELRIRDLFETDLTHLVRGYSEQVAGHIGLAKVGIKSQADVEKLLEGAQVWQRENKLNANQGAFDRQVKRAQFLYDAITRRQMDSTLDRGTKAALRHIRSFNVMRLMNNTGFAQLAEFGNILGRGGIDSMIELMPSFKQILRDRGKFGRKLDKGLYEELEALSGVGTTDLLGRHYLGWDSMEGQFSSMDKTLHNGKRVTSHLSGMAYLAPSMQRMAAGVMSHRFAKLSLKAKLSAANIRELKQLGLDDAMLQRVLNQVKTHATLRGKRVVSFNLEKWGTQERANFGLAMQRASRRMIQENSFGGSFPLMHTETGKLLMQFKTFVINAWTKQTLAGVALHDMRTFLSWATASFIGGLAYIAQSHVTHYGDDDKLDDLLSTQKIGAASFARAGWASLLPTAVDSTVPLLTMGYAKPVFSNARASGQQTNFITGSPAYDLIKTLTQTVPALWMSTLTDDFQLTETDAKRVIGLIPYIQAMGVRRQLEMVVEDAGLSKKRFSRYDQLDPMEELSDILSDN